MLEHPEKTSGLDAVRGLMALVVCVSHGIIILGPETWRLAQDAGAAAARVAVIVFYAISGYVISLSIRRNCQKNGGFSVRQYASARAFRIVPPLLVSYLLVLAVSFGVAERHTLWLQTLLGLVTLGARGILSAGLNDPLWTLQYEIQLYVIVGLVMLAAGLRKWWPVFLAACYLGAGFRPWLNGHLTPQAAFYVAFLAGWTINRRPVLAKRSLAFALFALSAALFAAYPLRQSAAQLSTDTSLLVLQMIFAGGCAMLLPILGCWETRLRSTGAYSYTLYIIHFPIFLLIAAQFGRGAIIAMLGVLATWLIAFALGRVTERPKEQRKAGLALLRWLQRLLRRETADA